MYNFVGYNVLYVDGVELIKMLMKQYKMKYDLL